ncbi:MAG: hypothetical protein GY913_17305 [Proteobacteria bacterium]|nr:hypothetical protein [Pseudomonadota bacterium]MCP4918664.1 hypothetical protein [Pseudomonadota bacterium]
MLFALLTTAHAAEPFVGVDYVPMGRIDLLWADSEQPSGTFVGEFDGLVSPPLSAYAGLFRGDHWAWTLGLSMARTRTVTWTAADRRTLTATGIRPALDGQRYLLPREVGAPTAWVGAGLYGVIPIARDRNDAYGEEEQSAANEGSREVMARIGGLGGRVGVGAEYLLVDGLTVGFRTHLWGYRGQRFTEDALLVSTLVSVDAALRVQIEF